MASTIGSSISFGGATLPAVPLVSTDFNRAPLDETGIGQASAEFDVGVFEGDVGLDLYFRPADHNVILSALATRAAASAVVITFASGQTASGNCRVVGGQHAVAVKQSLACRCLLKCTGSWTFSGGSTGA